MRCTYGLSIPSMRKFNLLVFLFLFGQSIWAQDTAYSPKVQDSVSTLPNKQASATNLDYSKTDTTFLGTDTNLGLANIDSTQTFVSDTIAVNIDVVNEWLTDTAFRAFLHLGILSSNQAAAQRKEGILQTAIYPDSLFYGLIFLLLLFGITRTFFPVYVQNIFSLSFQPVFRQVQTKELLSGQSISAVLLNLLFILSGGMLAAILTLYYQKLTFPFVQVFLLAATLLLCIYSIKFLFLRFAGWVFHAEDAAKEYSFVVFLINKVVGIVILPFLLLLAYSNDQWKPVFITALFCIVAIFFGMRYLVLLTRVRRTLPLNGFHFLIYICAVEVMPIFIIYKAVFFPERFSK